MKVIRWDKQIDPRKSDIRADWRAWAQQNGYARVRSVPLSVGQMSITFEVFKHEDDEQQDGYLLYQPHIEKTPHSEYLCICSNAEMAENLLERSRHMARRVMAIMQQQ